SWFAATWAGNRGARDDAIERSWRRRWGDRSRRRRPRQPAGDIGGAPNSSAALWAAEPGPRGPGTHAAGRGARGDRRDEAQREPIGGGGHHRRVRPDAGGARYRFTALRRRHPDA